MDIGFIGLGSMGSARAKDLAAAGHQVRAWNRQAAGAANRVLPMLDAAHAAHGRGGRRRMGRLGLVGDSENGKDP
jgi:3-hydroxyisobutyrate dehydrogenase-like beta-hydroxyacid dehydrogenase